MSLRYILPLFFSLVGFLTAAAQPKARYLTPKVELGNVMWKVPALAHFEIRNTGNQPLLVTGVYTDCACTVSVVVAPGAIGCLSHAATVQAQSV